MPVYPWQFGRKVLNIVYRKIATHPGHKAGHTKTSSQTGAVAPVQRFGPTQGRARLREGGEVSWGQRGRLETHGWPAHREVSIAATTFVRDWIHLSQ